MYPTFALKLQSVQHCLQFIVKMVFRSFMYVPCCSIALYNSCILLIFSFLDINIIMVHGPVVSQLLRACASCDVLYYRPFMEDV